METPVSEMLETSGIPVNASLTLQANIPENATGESLMENQSFTSALKEGLVESLPANQSLNVSAENVTISNMNVSNQTNSSDDGRRLSSQRYVSV